VQAKVNRNSRRIFGLSHGSSSWLVATGFYDRRFRDYRAVEAIRELHAHHCVQLKTNPQTECAAEAAQKHFRQGLSSNLHFRQFNGSKTRNVDKWGCQIARFCLNLRQGIGSNRGKELVQVTSCSLLDHIEFVNDSSSRFDNSS
jgi:hypothetical protein